MRTKAEFRATLNMLGMTLDILADELDVSSDEVWDWSHRDSTQIPDEAWEVLDRYKDLQMQVVTYALGKIDEIAQEHGHYPSEVTLHQWASQGSYDQHHDDGGDYRMANATSLLLAFTMR